MMFFGWPKPRTSADSGGQHLPSLPSPLADLMPPIKRARQRWAHLAPKSASVADFVAYLQDLSQRPYETAKEHVFTGVWAQEGLKTLYLETCQVYELGPVVDREFGSDLDRAGVKRWQADNRKKGTGPRPMMVEIPATADLAAQRAELAAIAKPAGKAVACASNIREVPRVHHWTAEGTLGKRVRNNKSLKARPGRNPSQMEVAA